MPAIERIRLPARTVAAMVWNYARVRLLAQVRSVAFIVVYLLLFQALMVGVKPAQAVETAAGAGLVVLGLACFLEGLLLGLMPLGERLGLQLPGRGGVPLIALFGALLGAGSTLAEPAVGALRLAAGGVAAWDAPLLFHLLENEPRLVVAAIGGGVGLAVALGMARIAFGWSVKPLIYAAILPTLGATVYCAADPSLRGLLGLAWDAGAVTTGAVTVPLVFALGIGVARASGRSEGSANGFGVILLASALPVLGVLILGALRRPAVPAPVAEEVFFAPARRAEALRLFADEAALARHAFQRGSAAGRRAFFADDAAYESAIRSLAAPAGRAVWLGEVSLSAWLEERASPEERRWLPRTLATEPAALNRGGPIARLMLREALGAARAVVPLTALLLGALWFVLRGRPRQTDEFLLGFGLALIGMALLMVGIRVGLVPLGERAGRPLPQVLLGAARERGRVAIEDFDPSATFVAYDAEGVPRRFFFLQDRSGTPRPAPFDPEAFETERRRYEHVIRRAPLIRARLTAVGAAIVALFAFGLGFGATMAEPALNALGLTVEEITVGNIRRAGVVRSVSLGVGLGVAAGIARILYDLPLLWLLAPPYLLLLPLTHWSEENFAGLAWDCGGVTTGIVTVPLVLALGLGLGRELNVADGFGVLAMASVYPILTMLIHGLIIRRRQRRSIHPMPEEGGHV